MSKKMLKRSLALGALMAFVITGSAYAETIKLAEDTVVSNNGTNQYYSGYNNVDLNGFDLEFKDAFAGAGTYNFIGNGNLTIKGINQNYRSPLDSYGKVDITGNLVLDSPGHVGIHTQGSGTETYIKANKITITAKKNGITAESYNNSKITVIANELESTVNEERHFIRSARNNIIDVTVGNTKIDSSKGESLFKMTGGKLSFSATSGYLKGDILVDSVDSTVDNAIVSGKIDLTLGEAVTYTGSTRIDNAESQTGDNAPAIALDLSGTWNLTDASTLTNATFNAGSTLVIEGEKYVYDSKEGAVNTYALNGAGDKATLTVENGAKLKINGITETTYNIAQGFTNLEGAVDKWEVSDINTLMRGVAWTTKDGLQVEVFAKKAEQMANDTGMSTSTAGLVQGIIDGANSDPQAKVEGTPQYAAAKFIESVLENNPTDAAVGNAINAATKMGEAGGNSATAASIVKNVTGVTNDRLSFNCGHSAPHKGGHGVGLFEEGSGADIWVEYVHGKDEVEDMPSTAGASSYEGQYNGIVMGVDFKKVNKFQSGIAFNYGEGDTNSVGNDVRTHSDYDFWGVGYYGSIHNDDSNVIFDISYAQTDSDVTQNNSGTAFEANPETTTWSAGVKLEKLYQNNNVQIVPYTGLRYMSIDADDYSTRNGEFYYSMDRQDIWLLPLGVSIRQEIANDNGWTVSPRVDLSYIWAFGDTNSNMEVKSPFAGVSQLGYDVMDDGSFLGLVGIEAHKGQWGYGVAYSYQKGDHSESKKWYVDVNYSF